MSHLIPTHLLCSAEKIPAFLSPHTPSNHQTEGIECSTIENDNETRNSIDLKSSQTKINGLRSTDPISLLEKSYNFKDLDGFREDRSDQIVTTNMYSDANISETEAT